MFDEQKLFGNLFEDRLITSSRLSNFALGDVAQCKGYFDFSMLDVPRNSSLEDALPTPPGP